MNAFRRLSYHLGLVKLARVLHVSAGLKKWYYRMVVPPDQILRLQVGGTEMKFYVRTPVELRDLERTTFGEEDFFAALLSALHEGDVFFDIGSNLGKFVIPIAKVVGTHGGVAAFEPEAQTFRRLEENIRLNELSNVRVFQKALGEQDGTGRLLVAGNTNSGSSLLPVPGSSNDLSENVDLVEGDRFREAEHLPVPRAVKIDVEGYEYFVLRGLKRTLSDPRCILLCCEVHNQFLPAGVTLELIEAFVRSSGFSSVDKHFRGGEVHLIATKGAPAAGA